MATTPGRNAKSKQVSQQLDVKIEVTSLSDPSLIPLLAPFLDRAGFR